MRNIVRSTARLTLALGLLLALAGCPTGTTATLGDTAGNDQTDDTGTPVGGTVTIEPDDFDDGTELTDVDSRVTLSTALDDNAIVEIFVVTATDDADNAATGERVFGHSEIPFWNDNRRLRVDFKGRGASVTLIFINGEAFDPSIGRLEAYNADDKLIAEYVTEALEPGQSEEMSVAASNIAYVVAYVADGEGSFGRFDKLTFTATSGSSTRAGP